MNYPGLIDLHIHSSPDVRPRRHTDLELAAFAREAGARAIVIKSHHVPTMDRAWHTTQATPGLSVFGGLALNWPVGGLNAHAVSTALKQGARIIWLPTLHAENHRRKEGHQDGIAVTSQGRVVAAAEVIFEMIAEADAILATGHIGAEEMPVVVAAATAKKVRRILITHPEHSVVGMNLEQQRDLLRNFPVIFERHYAQPNGRGGYRSNFAENLDSIKALGFASTVLATDAGQVENDSWTDCWKNMLGAYGEAGISEEALRQMCSLNPARLLNLPA